MSNNETEDKKQEMNRQMEEIRRQEEECDELQKKLSAMEEENGWQNKKIKEINDNLIDGYPSERKLQAVLIEKEELLQRKINLEKDFYEECRDMIREQRKRIESMKEACEEELRNVHAGRNVWS